MSLEDILVQAIGQVPHLVVFAILCVLWMRDAAARTATFMEALKEYQEQLQRLTKEATAAILRAEQQAAANTQALHEVMHELRECHGQQGPSRRYR